MRNILIYSLPSFGFRDRTLNMAKTSKLAEFYYWIWYQIQEDYGITMMIMMMKKMQLAAKLKCHDPPQKNTLMTPHVEKRWVSSVERCHKSPSRIGMPLNCWSADMEYAMRPGPHRKGTRANFSWTSTLFQWVTWPTSQELHRLPMLDNWVLNPSSISIMWFVYQWS